jgi:hypothetical protein
MNLRPILSSFAVIAIASCALLSAQACSSKSDAGGYSPVDASMSTTADGNTGMMPTTDAPAFGSDVGLSIDAQGAGGCQGLQCMQTVCAEDGGTTSISGYVYDPIDKNPLFNVVVYVPLDPTMVVPLPRGIDQYTCLGCNTLFTGTPIASALTDATGHFVIPNVPVVDPVPLVVQVGKWRKQYSVSGVVACQDNPQTAHFNLPKNASDGTNANLPDIAVSTGAADTLECLFRRIGVDASEYVAGASTNGHIHIFQGGGGSFQPLGPTISGAATSSSGLWDTDKDIDKYDALFLSCEGSAANGQQPQILHDYATLGGRVFASHFHESWFNTTPYSSENIAAWPSGFPYLMKNLLGNVNGNIVTTGANNQPFPKGVALGEWLANTHALNDAGTLPIVSADNEVGAVNNPPAQEWIHDNKDNATQFFSFDTPTDAKPNDAGVVQYCGRIVFSDLHVSSASTDDLSKEDTAVPSGCADADLSPQEKALEFMLFDLASCVVPDTATPTAVPVK